MHRIAAGLPLCSPDKNSKDDDPTMEEVSDDEPTPALVTGFSMARAQANFNAVMTEMEQEEQLAPPVPVFRMLQEEQRYNLDLLVHHLSAKQQIAGEQVKERAVTALVVADPCFVDQQRVLFESACSARTARAEADVAAGQEVVDGNNATVGRCASFTPGHNDWETGPSGSIVDLTSIDDGQPANDDKE